jgi:DNA-directed RNA polymerase subunit K/omega
VIYRPSQIGAFEFAVVAGLRAEQLRRGCVPRVEGSHKFAVTAQLEVISGKVVRAVEGTVQEPAEAVATTPPLCLDGSGNSEIVATPALTTVASSDGIGRGEES